MSGRKLGRTTSHRKALFANLATSLLKHGQIKTTLPKAKDLRKVVEPLITLAKQGDLSARRLAARTITEADVVKHLFDNIGPAMKERSGGYTRVLKAGFRQGDAAPMAVIELTDKPQQEFVGKGDNSDVAKEAPKAEKETKETAKKEAAAPKAAASGKPAASSKGASAKASSSAKPTIRKTQAKG